MPLEQPVENKNEMCITLYNNITFSLSVSKADVASSRSNILGSLIKARAMATRCFCPPDSCVP